MIGQPLNRLVTFRPPAIDQMEPVERCRLFERLRNKAGQFARDHKFPFTGAWSRETHPGVVGPATGEHMHLLMHVPRKWQKAFDAVVVNWLPGPTSVKAGVAHYRKRLVTFPSGVHVFCSLGYIVKQMDSRAAYRNKFRSGKGGP